MDNLEIIFTALAIIVAAGALFISWYYNRKAMFQQSMDNIITRWDSVYIINCRTVIAINMKNLVDKQNYCPLNEPPKGSIIDSIQMDMKVISNFFDSLGARASKGYVDKELAYTLFGKSIIRHWNLLGPYIKLEQRRTDINGAKQDYYQKHFEWLVKDVKKRFPGYMKKLNNKIKFA